MPRIYTSQSDPVDLCKRCFPRSEARAFEIYGNLGDGPDGRGNCFGWNEEHPGYEDEPDYRCHKCKRILGENDDYFEPYKTRTS